MKIFEKNEGLPLPKTNIQEILLTLICQGYVSIFDFPYLSSYRTRVSDINLSGKVRLERKTDTRCNKFGNSYTYVIYFLPQEEKIKAKDYYLELIS